jgi:hypothetical protein
MCKFVERIQVLWLGVKSEEKNTKIKVHGVSIVHKQ